MNPLDIGGQRSRSWANGGSAGMLRFVLPLFNYAFLAFQGEAIGELYVDDYHSTEHKKGQYLHRTFSFKNNILQSR